MKKIKIEDNLSKAVRYFFWTKKEKDDNKTKM